MNSVLSELLGLALVEVLLMAAVAIMAYLTFSLASSLASMHDVHQKIIRAIQEETVALSTKLGRPC